MPIFHKKTDESARGGSRTACRDRVSSLLRAGPPVLSWMFSFALTAWLAGVWLPPADLPSTVREKLAHLAEHGDDYDAIFVGSSRIQSHIMPSLFDRLAAERGLTVKSFNAGVASMHTPEDGWLLEQILARKPARLRWIFLEIDFFDAGLEDGQMGTLRGVPWHDWPRFRQLCRRMAVMSDNLNFRDRIAELSARLRDFVDHLATFGQRESQLGRGAQLFDRWRLSINPEPMRWENLGADGDGFRPAKTNTVLEKKSLARLAKLVAERTKILPKADEADRVSQAVLGEAIAQIIRAGARPVLIIPPRTRLHYFVPSAENARLAAVVDLCNPVKFPELYEAKHRVDTSHLNAAGAEVFTRIVADRFLEIARPTPKPNP